MRPVTRAKEGSCRVDETFCVKASPLLSRRNYPGSSTGSDEFVRLSLTFERPLSKLSDRSRPLGKVIEDPSKGASTKLDDQPNEASTPSFSDRRRVWELIRRLEHNSGPILARYTF